MSYYATNPWTSTPSYDEVSQCVDEIHFFEGWQDAVRSLVAIWPAAGRSEVLTLQRIINADVSDACGRCGTWLLDSWAEDYAHDIRSCAMGMVACFAQGDRDLAFDNLDSIQDLLVAAIDRGYEGDDR